MKEWGDLGGLWTLAGPRLRDVLPSQRIAWISFWLENVPTASAST